MRASLERAIQIAVEAHAGQTDKAGAPYILHPLRLMFGMNTESERIVAVLHDVVEDTGWTLDRLRKEGFSEDVVSAVDHLTKRKAEGETYDAFIERVKKNNLARRIKIADLEDNMNMTRLPQLSKEDLKRLEKYHRALMNLKSADYSD